MGKEWADNARMSTDSDTDGIDESWSSFGQVETIAIGPTGNLYNGHQRLIYLAKKFGKDYRVDVRRSSRELSEEEKHKLTLYLHAGATGRWNWNKLEKWPKEELIQYGMNKSFRNRLAQDFEKLQEIFGDESYDDDETDWKEEGEGKDESDGSMLKLLSITIDEPNHKVERGQVYTIGRHTLICVNVLTDWSIWKNYLKGDAIFAPYPGPFVPLSKIAQNLRIVMVQPDPYIAGHILDRFEDINGPGSVKLAK